MLSFEFMSRYFTPFFTALFSLFIPNTAGNKLITYTNGCVGRISSALALAQIPDMMLQCTAAAADSDLIGETHYKRC